ncbi:MAG TPA: class C beta-lactamase-related serine hydrolase [Sneathiellales bacterium]|nr:class C beta-lactamase-related serine hydrolase [Sneathiellales bacterium]
MGVSGENAHLPVSENTSFQVSTCLNTYVAAAAALLVDDGSLSWDDPVDRHLSDFVLMNSPVCSHVTIRNLLGQRLEFSNAPELTRRKQIGASTHVASFREKYAEFPLAFELVTEIVEQVSGQSLAQFLDQRLFEPLGFANTSFTEGRLSTSSNDCATWLRLHLRRDFHGRTPLIKWSTMIDMHTSQCVATPDERRGQLLAGYGMGWHISTYANHRILYEEGHGDDTSAFHLLLSKENLGIAVHLGSRCPAAARGIIYRLLNAFLGQPVIDGPPSSKPGSRKI